MAPWNGDSVADPQQPESSNPLTLTHHDPAHKAGSFRFQPCVQAGLQVSRNAMQSAQVIDWPLIQTLYTSGLGPNEISKRTGVKPDTIASRASRFRWRDLMAKAKPIVQVAIQRDREQTEDNPQSNALAKASAIVRSKLSDELIRAVDTLSSTKPSKRLDTQAKRASVMQTLAGAAKPVFGWSEGQSQPIVRINVLGNATIDSSPAIDAEVVPNPVPAQVTDAQSQGNQDTNI